MFNNLNELVESITPEMHQQLKRAIEIGKWPNGQVISKEQRGMCLQAVIAYEEKHLPPEQRTGYIPPKEHTHCGSTTGDIADDDAQPLNLQ